MSDNQNITPATSDSQPSFEFRIGDRVETDYGTFGTVISIGSLSDSSDGNLQWIWIDFDNGSRGKRAADELTLVAPIENATPKTPAVSADDVHEAMELLDSIDTDDIQSWIFKHFKPESVAIVKALEAAGYVYISTFGKVAISDKGHALIDSDESAVPAIEAALRASRE